MCGPDHAARLGRVKLNHYAVADLCSTEIVCNALPIVRPVVHYIKQKSLLPK